MKKRSMLLLNTRRRRRPLIESSSVGTEKKIVRGDPPGCVIQVNPIEMEITLMRRLFITTAAAALFFAGGVANAHPKLVSASPAANAAVATPEKISLQFSEKLVPAFSKADLTMAAMPGMDASLQRRGEGA